MSISFDFDESAFQRALLQAANEVTLEKVRELQVAFDTLIETLNSIDLLPSKVEAVEIAARSSFHEVFEGPSEQLLPYLQIDERGRYHRVLLELEPKTSL
jgi:hypothetical protein